MIELVSRNDMVFALLKIQLMDRSLFMGGWVINYEGTQYFKKTLYQPKNIFKDPPSFYGISI